MINLDVLSNLFKNNETSTILNVIENMEILSTATTNEILMEISDPTAILSLSGDFPNNETTDSNDLSLNISISPADKISNEKNSEIKSEEANNITSLIESNLLTNKNESEIILNNNISTETPLTTQKEIIAENLNLINTSKNNLSTEIPDISPQFSIKLNQTFNVTTLFTKSSNLNTETPKKSVENSTLPIRLNLPETNLIVNQSKNLNENSTTIIPKIIIEKRSNDSLSDNNKISSINNIQENPNNLTTLISINKSEATTQISENENEINSTFPSPISTTTIQKLLTTKINYFENKNITEFSNLFTTTNPESTKGMQFIGIELLN